MRELKFRAWDLKRLEEFGQPCMSNPFTFNDINIDCIGRRYLHFTIVLRELLFYLDECEIMQYTGLKDNNGKEIFEGDIVKYISKLDGHISYWVIKYYSNIASFVVENKDKQYRNIHQVDFTGDINKGDVYNSFYELVGNIYENPKLLEEI